MFRRLRKQVKTWVIVIAVTFVAGLLYAGGTSFFGGSEAQLAQAAIATVNGEDITYAEFQQAYISQLQMKEMQEGRLDGRMYESVKYETLDSFIDHLLLSQEIEQREVEVSSKEIDERLAELKGRFDDEETYQQQLKMANITEQQLRNMIEQEAQMEKLRAEVVGEIEVTEQELKDAYEQVRASHILVRPMGEGEEGWKVAEQYINEVYADVDNYDFADLVRTYSQDTGSLDSDGDIGFIKRGDTVPEFEEAAFGLEVGEVSEPVRTQFGYHIIKVTERRDAKGEEFEAAKEELTNQLRAEKEQQAFEEWFAGVREAAQVTVNDYQLLAYEKAMQKDYEGAVELYQKALEENPENAYLYISLGDVYMQLEKLPEAIEQYEAATERLTNDALLFFVLGHAYQRNEQAEKAEEAFLKASELAPNDMTVQIAVSNSLYALGRTDRVNEVEERIEEIERIREEQRKLREEAAQEQNEAESIEELTEEGESPTVDENDGE